MRYDCIIIGSGPAGLSAAINLQTYGKNFLWFGNGRFSDKVAKAELVTNYPGLPAVTGKELSAAFLHHEEQLGLTVTDKIVSAIYDMGGYYNILAENEFFETSTILFATGVTMSNPYAGETEFVGRGVSYCATCDGALYRGKKIAVIATAKRFEHEINFLTEMAEQVYLFPFYKECEIDASNVTMMKSGIKEIKGGFRVEQLVLADGSELAVDGVFIMRSSIAPTTLLAGIATEEGHIAVDRQMRTNLPGVFAAGDCTGKPYQYAKAVGEGNVAAHGILDFLG